MNHTDPVRRTRSGLMEPRGLMRLRGLMTGIAATALLLVGAGPSPVLAGAFPDKPIRLVVPFPPGGPSDNLARILAEVMAASLGVAVVTDNRPGGHTLIGAQAVTGAPADGYTLLLALDSTLTMNQSLFSRLPYDPLKDFSAIGRVADIPVVIAASPSFPANTVAELIAEARKTPGMPFFGASAIPMQLAGESFNRAAGISMSVVNYKGAAQSVQALLGGEIALSFEGAATVLPHWRAGKLKVLATTGDKALDQAPGVPTVKDAGLPGYSFAVWAALVGPAGLPPAVVQTLNKAMVKAMQTPTVRDRLAELGIIANTSSPEALDRQIRSDAERWGGLIRDLGLKIE